MLGASENQMETPLVGRQKSKASLLKIILTLCALIGLIGFGGFYSHNLALKLKPTEESVGGRPMTEEEKLLFAKAYKWIIEKAMAPLTAEYEANDGYKTLKAIPRNADKKPQEDGKPTPLSEKFAGTSYHTLTCAAEIGTDFYGPNNDFDIQRVLFKGDGTFKVAETYELEHAIKQVAEDVSLHTKAIIPGAFCDGTNVAGKQHTNFGFHITTAATKEALHLTLRLKCPDGVKKVLANGQEVLYKNTAICKTWENMKDFYRTPNAKCKDILIGDTSEQNKKCSEGTNVGRALTANNILKIMNDVEKGPLDTLKWTDDLMTYPLVARPREEIESTDQ